jgi:carbonic anhydrase
MLAKMTSENALSESKEGNRRFRENRMLHPRGDLECVKATAQSPRPFAAILTCADSRVPPEIMFDQGIGDLFTVRVAGNVANGDEIASIEYAVEQLHTRLCVVMGHTGCRAVQTVISGSRLTLNIDQLFRQIKTAVGKARLANAWMSRSELINAAVRTNVYQSIETLRMSLRKLIEQQNVQIVGAEYQVESGEVVWLDSSY